MNDAELVDLARRGDTGAFGELVERHRAAVYRAALAVLGSAEEAEDAAQDAFVAAFRKLDGYRSTASFKTWLLAIAWRGAISRRRGVIRRLRRFVSGDDAGWHERALSEPTPEQALLNGDFRRHVGRLLATLPAKLRDSVLLTSTGDHSYEEIAAMLSIPVGTLKWRVSEGRRRLREKLVDLGFHHD